MIGRLIDKVLDKINADPYAFYPILVPFILLVVLPPLGAIACEVWGRGAGGGLPKIRPPALGD